MHLKRVEPVGNGNSRKRGMHRRALILIAIFFVVGELGAVRGDNVLEADGPGQNLTSINKVYLLKAILAGSESGLTSLCRPTAH
jgi:hypothetical protein